jgi:hypothetical protein
MTVTVNCASIGYLGQSETNRNHTICVMLSKVVKPSKKTVAIAVPGIFTNRKKLCLCKSTAYEISSLKASSSSAVLKCLPHCPKLMDIGKELSKNCCEITHDRAVYNLASVTLEQCNTNKNFILFELC